MILNLHDIVKLKVDCHCGDMKAGDERVVTALGGDFPGGETSFIRVSYHDTCTFRNLDKEIEKCYKQLSSIPIRSSFEIHGKIYFISEKGKTYKLEYISNETLFVREALIVSTI